GDRPAIQLARQLVLEIIEPEPEAAVRVAHVNVPNAVDFHGGRYQVMPKPRARVTHRAGRSLQADFALGQHMNAWNAVKSRLFCKRCTRSISVRRMVKGTARTFSYRAGVRIRDSVLACDATGGSDLIFVSHAELIDGNAGDGNHSRRLPRARAGRRKILTTDATLALSGPAGERLRPHTLVAAYGRPFNLGGMRLELFPSGYGPGAASLLCEQAGHRLVYSGPVGTTATEVRVADALCLDGTFGSPRFTFPRIEQALAAVVGFVT